MKIFCLLFSLIINLAFPLTIMAEVNQSTSSSQQTISTPSATPFLTPTVFLSNLWENLKEIVDLKENKPEIKKASFRSDESVEIALNDYRDKQPQASLYQEGELVEDIEIKIEDGNLKIKPDRNFKPGKYSIKISTNDSKDEEVEQEFTWGVLAINTNKSIYLPDEKAYLQMAVLNNDGHTVCGASLKLEILSPTSETTVLSAQDNTIKYSDTCSINNVTDNPDYFAYFQTKEIGVYNLKLTNLDNNYQIEGSFEVKENIPFEVERISATRINPFKSNYVMSFNIKTKENFVGEVKEIIPASFEVLDQDSFLENENEKSLTWQVNWQAGENYQLSYEYDAPDISPQFYLLGPLQIADFQEVRSWQIAADAAAVTFRGYAISGTTGQTTFTVRIPVGVAVGDDLYLLAISRDHVGAASKYTCVDNDSGGNTWTEKAISSDRKTTLFWKKATSGTADKIISCSGGLGSFAGGLSVFYGGATGDPTTNIVMEENASGNETHAGFTPDYADSFIVFGVTNDTNDIDITNLAATTLGSLEPEQWAAESTGGSDCKSTLTGKAQVGGPSATGNFTWSQTNGTTDSISFAIKPYVNYSPTVALDSPGVGASITDTTPDLVFTGTDAESDDIEYNIQLDTVDTFDSQAPPAGLFSDDFESGDFSEWDWTEPDGSDLSVSGAAALNGSYGMSVLINDTNAVRVFMDSAFSAETRFRNRFYFDPNGISIPNDNAFVIFYTWNEDYSATYIIKLINHSSVYSIQVIEATDGAWSKSTDEHTISDAPHTIEIDWTASTAPGANNGQIVLIIDGVTEETLTGIDNDTESVGAVALGAVDEVDAGTSGTIYYDDFVSNNDGTEIGIGGPLLDKFSVSDTGFYRVGDTHPFTSAQAVTYTVQAADILDLGTYYWRTKGIDPSGNNEYGAWSSTGSFTITQAATGPTLDQLMRHGVWFFNGLKQPFTF